MVHSDREHKTGPGCSLVERTSLLCSSQDCFKGCRSVFVLASEGKEFLVVVVELKQANKKNKKRKGWNIQLHSKHFTDFMGNYSDNNFCHNPEA